MLFFLIIFLFFVIIINGYQSRSRVSISMGIRRDFNIKMGIRRDFNNIRKSIKSAVSQIEDDGYNRSHKLQGVFKVLDELKNRYIRRQPGHLILIRHGESEWNDKKLFTGWVDVDLNERGRREIEHAGRLLLERGLKIFSLNLRSLWQTSFILLG